MTVQHADIFHCLKCGRMLYEPHGTRAPVCCDQPMVRAVADVEKDLPPEETAPLPRVAGDEFVLLAELVEISNWCRSLIDIDGSRYQELAQRLEGLHELLADRFQEEQGGRASGARRSRGPEPPPLPINRQLLLASIRGLAADLRQSEPLHFPWSEVCERIDLLVVELRRQEEPG
jgi:hypothetical protein